MVDCRPYCGEPVKLHRTHSCADLKLYWNYCESCSKPTPSYENEEETD